MSTESRTESVCYWSAIIFLPLAALAYNDTLPASDFIIPEKTPTELLGQGRTPRQEGVRQFPGGVGAAQH